MTISLTTKYKILYMIIPYMAASCLKLTYTCITIQSNLKWASHISEITSKVNRTLGLLRMNLHMAPQIIEE